ncbi:PIR protein [Plasmodium malariae]|uniref:PIR protein n=1 Tax=Plasmodium malariae TaxID=5858 RepID=A0A1D3JHE2_PLAMA|nr:PIR protein [Plasmodium malariae]SBT85609.1 PIR protein [Plasmodium malariae]
MTSGVPGENETSVTLFLKYKKVFEDVISDILNNKRGGIGENPGRKCAKMNNYPDFTTPCQQVGRYLIEIKENYKHDSLKRCKYLNYLINADNRYNNSSWFQGYRDFSSQTENICTDEIKTIPKESLDKLKKLYGYYDNFSIFNGKDNDSDGNICKCVKECYNIYNDNYKKCQKNSNDPLCEELINFKYAYDDKMDKLSPCIGLPKTLPQIEQTSTIILPTTKKDDVFVPILTTAIVLLMSFTIFFLYKFTPLKSWIYKRLLKKKIIELNKFQEESRESLQNLHEVVNRNYEGSFHNISYQPQGHT